MKFPGDVFKVDGKNTKMLKDCKLLNSQTNDALPIWRKKILKWDSVRKTCKKSTKSKCEFAIT